MICNPRRRNARVQKHNGSARTRFAPSKNFFDQKSLKYYVNGGLGVSIMGDLDEAQRSRSPPRGHPSGFLVTFGPYQKSPARRRNPLHNSQFISHFIPIQKGSAIWQTLWKPCLLIQLCRHLGEVVGLKLLDLAAVEGGSYSGIHGQLG